MRTLIIVLLFISSLLKAQYPEGKEILDRIDNMNIDLVSMATHGTGGGKIVMDESVTAEVVRHANCPLLVWSAEPQCPTVNE